MNLTIKKTKDVDHRLSWANRSFGERYLAGKSQFQIVCFGWKDILPSETEQFIAIVERDPKRKLRVLNDSDILGRIAVKPRVARDDYVERSVLVDVTQLVESPQGVGRVVVSSVVRLYRLDEVDSTVRDKVEPTSPPEVNLRAMDWKRERAYLAARQRSSSTTDGKGVNDVIEGRTQIEQAIARNGKQSLWDWLKCIDAYDAFMRMRVYIKPHSAWVVFDPPVDKRLSRFDMRVCPIKF